MLNTSPLRIVSVAFAALMVLAPRAGAMSSPPQDAPALEFSRGDTICLLGNALAERMQHHGWLELVLQTRFPEHELAIRNLGFGADELDVHQRTLNFGKFSEDGMESNLPNERFVPWDRYLTHEGADVVFAFFGYNESFAGAEGVAAFREKLEGFVDHVLAQRYDGEEPPMLVLFGSIPQENLGDANHPDGREHNRRIELYNACMADVARAKGVRFVDIYRPMVPRYAAAEDPLTINGIHLTERGNEVLAEVIDSALFSNGATSDPDFDGIADPEAMRSLVCAKNRLWFQRYRATDGFNVYGGRSRLVYEGAAGEGSFANFDVLQRELDHLDGLVASRDRAIWSLARGEQAGIDDSSVPPLISVATNKQGEGPDGQHAFLYGRDAISRTTTAPGMHIEIFADERQFPELVNPVQMAWDTRGRLWVAVWPTYPHWQPDLPMNDKLLILEDTNNDGRADKCTTFAGDLHNPTGFEFWNGGVLLAAVPDLVFLKDTDGDDRADHRERLLHGLSSADTHHSANSFVLGPGGALYFQEGTFHQTQIETIYGPVRNHNGCVWRFEPRTHRVERYIPYNYANPHGHVFDRWGQDFMTDGTGNLNYYSLPFSGFIAHPAKHASYFPFFKQRSRPAGGTEILSSGHFPAENQGNYLIANVIGFRGVFQYKVEDDGSGFSAVEVAPIVQSTDLNFRPVDLEVGPDGAIYILDWHNPIIGHMQHHLRDPSRDAAHGRVYRVTFEGRELLQPPLIAGQGIVELLELLKSPEDRVRYRTRIELSGRDSDVVVRAARAWVETLDPLDPEHEHQLLEALWLHQQHNRMDRELLVRLLEASDPRARAAATRVLRYGRHHVPDALELLAARAVDSNARVRLEAVVAASFFDSAVAATVALEALRQPTDRFLDYALSETMRGLERHWKAALRAGEPVAADNPAGIEYLLGRVSSEELVNLPRIPLVLRALLTRHGPDLDARLVAATELAATEGTTRIEVVLAAIQAVDSGRDSHAAHTVHELGELLARLARESGETPVRAALVALAEQGLLTGTRSVGYAALIARDCSVDRVWASASKSVARLSGLLAAVARIESTELRADLGDRIRPLMFALPASSSGQGGQAGTGLDVAFFEPAPANAKRETLAELTAQANLHVSNFTLDLPPARRSDSFGVRFEGLLFVPKSGTYGFTTNSDDGSRLYIGGRCVVDNDGAHGMVAKSGEIELLAGPHPITVTYFEMGGSEGLEVSWQGPGFDRTAIPAEVLGSNSATTLRAAAIRAMAQIPGRDVQKLADAARLLGDGLLLDATMELVNSVPAERRSAQGVQTVIDTLAAYVSGLSAEQQTLPSIIAALEVGRRITGALSEGEAVRALELLDGLGGSVILIRTLPHQMRYDLGEFWVETGRPVSIVFQNNDVMPHNLVVTIPGAMAEVGAAAERLSASSGAKTTEYVPAMDAVLWHTRLIMPGESERLTFVAPEKSGDHPYVCTYPGHWRVMNGVMHVVDEIGPGEQTVRRQSDEKGAAVREFVREWTTDDLTPRIVDGWEKGRSPANGRVLFDEAGCIKCHLISGEGAIGGPELTKIREKYNGAELLRHVIEPSLDVAEEYRFYIFEVEESADVIGRILEEDDENLRILPTLLEPENVITLAKDSIIERWDTRLSPMPTGLLVTFTADEILNLLSFLQAPKDK